MGRAQPRVGLTSALMQPRRRGGAEEMASAATPSPSGRGRRRSRSLGGAADWLRGAQRPARRPTAAAGLPAAPVIGWGRRGRDELARVGEGRASPLAGGGGWGLGVVGRRLGGLIAQVVWSSAMAGGAGLLRLGPGRPQRRPRRWPRSPDGVRTRRCAIAGVRYSAALPAGRAPPIRAVVVWASAERPPRRAQPRRGWRWRSPRAVPRERGRRTKRRLSPRRCRSGEVQGSLLGDRQAAGRWDSQPAELVPAAGL